MTKSCTVCHNDHDDKPEICRGCWYSGAMLAENMAPVIKVLEAATGSRWYAEHTGGGCFWLRTWVHHPFAYPKDEDETEPYIVITAWGDVLSGDSTPEEARDQWLVGTYPTGWAGQGEDGEYFEDVADERLPMLVRELITAMREECAHE